MPIVVMIGCDGCGEEEQTSASMDDGVNVIESLLDGWVHDDDGDWCPRCAPPP